MTRRLEFVWRGGGDGGIWTVVLDGQEIASGYYRATALWAAWRALRRSA